MIYFIECESGHIKIGFTNRGIKGRLAHVQCANPLKTSLFKVIKGNRDKEKYIHSLFKTYHVRGEWFLFSDEIRQFALDDPEILITLNKRKKTVDYDEESIFTKLEEFYGNHTKVAYALEISPRQYRKIRSTGRVHPSLKLLMKMIIIK